MTIVTESRRLAGVFVPAPACLRDVCPREPVLRVRLRAVCRTSRLCLVLPRSAFSRSQLLQKGEARRCLACVAASDAGRNHG